ncbi:MAG: glycosyltransferase [Snowella sp.]|nr:glycosyltransferase [Snowella sp.]
MKILFVIPALGSVYGGTSQCVLSLAEALGDRGIEVDIVTTNANGSSGLNLPMQTWIQETSYRVQYFPYWHLSDYKVSLPLTAWLFKNVNAYDLVHTNAIFSYTNLPAHVACKIKKIPYIMTPHGMLEPWALAYKSWKKQLYFNLFEKPFLKQANAIQALASTEAQNLQSLELKSPLLIIPNGIHQKDFEQLPDPEIFYQQFPETRHKKLILFLGRIDPKKGLDLLVTAFAKVQAQFPETHLIIAGPDNISYSPTVKQWLRSNQCLEAVTFTGMLSGSLKYAALAAASVYVAPSYSEGFSVSVLEGMAAGLPCVITTGCNFPEAAKENVALVVDINAEAIAEGLLKYLENTEAAQVMGSRSRQFILKNYSWEQISKQLICAYQQIINDLPNKQKLTEKIYFYYQSLKQKYTKNVIN